MEYGTLVPYIQNRDKSGWCPMEKLSFECDTPDEIVARLKTFIGGFNSSQIGS